jgi:hypothetical protein
MSGLKDGGMVDRVGLSAWRQRRRRQRQQQQHSSSNSVPPCLVHIIERSSPFSGSDDAEASGEDGVQVVRCPKSGVNFFDLGDFDRQFSIARERASSSLQSYLAKSSSRSMSTLPQPPKQQQQQSLVGAGSQGQQQQQARSSVVLPSARRSAAAAAAVAVPGGSRRATGSVSPSPSQPTSSV